MSNGPPSVPKLKLLKKLDFHLGIWKGSLSPKLLSLFPAPLTTTLNNNMASNTCMTHFMKQKMHPFTPLLEPPLAIQAFQPSDQSMTELIWCPTERREPSPYP